MQSSELSKKDYEVLNFLLKYKMLKVEDASLIYKTKRYYRERINNLIYKKYVKRYKSFIVLDKEGRKALGETGNNYIKNIKNEAYMERLKNIASIATLSIDSPSKFIPSWEMKEKDKFTETARRYIGKIMIDNEEFLTYYISAKKEHVYIKQLIFDINKAINYDNIIIFVENFDAINKRYSNLAFGKYKTLIILNTDENKEIIRKYNSIYPYEILERIFDDEILVSDWEKADYLLEDGTYILYMPFIDTEKIERINWYYEENTNIKRNINIVTLRQNEQKLKEILKNKCSIKIIDNYIGGESEV